MTAKAAITGLFVCAGLLAPMAQGQTPSTAPSTPQKPYTAPRTSFGTPSFEGVWTQNFVVMMESTPRTPALTVSEAEAKVMGQMMAKAVGDALDRGLDPEVPELMKATDGLPIVRGERRTRSVVLPEDGKIPYTAASRQESARGPRNPASDNHEERPNWERCITNLGLPPITFMGSTNIRHIVQTPTHVVLRTEYGDEVRVIPFTDKHKPKELFTVLGDSIARWDGDTLVIETIGLPERDRKRAFGNNLIVPGGSTVTERITRVSDNELVYQFTVVDPTAYSAPWLAEYSIFKSDHPNYEHACHEGNYSLPNILRGARVDDARKAGRTY